MIALSPTPVDRFKQGIVTGLSSLLAYGAYLWYDSPYIKTSCTHLGFFVTHILLLFVSIWVSTAIPRRPQIFRFEKLASSVDGQYTVSLISRCTLSWATPLLSSAMRKAMVEFDDLPLLDTNTSVKQLLKRFNHFPATSLWRRIAKVHCRTFIRQWSLTLIYCLGTLAPQYCLLKLLRALENSSSGLDSQVGVWMALLSLAQLIHPWIETWLLWVGWCHISLPIYVQLSGLITDKVMRKKDTRDIKADDKHTSPKDLGPNNWNRLSAETRPNEGNHVAQENRQEQINLISVDARRISDFLSYNGM